MLQCTIGVEPLQDELNLRAHTSLIQHAFARPLPAVPPLEQ